MACKIALAGNPNSGKTTIFNRLVGAREKIGNWPGTTVERKEGVFLHDGDKFFVFDLPGVYSLNVTSLDEKIARDYLIEEHPEVVIVVVDASNLERHLYLATQLLEMGENVIICLNKIDLARHLGLEINTEALAAILKAPVVETSALHGLGIKELKSAVIQNCGRIQAPLTIDYGEFEPDVKDLKKFLFEQNLNLGLSPRALAVMILKRDEDILSKLRSHEHFKAIEDVLAKTGGRFSGDPLNFFIEKKYAFIKGVVSECALKHLTLEDRVTISDKIDKIVTNKYLGIPIFLLFMYFLFSLVYKVGDPLVEGIHKLFFLLGAQITTLMQNSGWPAWLASLISDGIVAGLGSVLAFLPYIMLLYLGISFLQDSGYLARGAFIMDRMMHALGLHGKSFIPMLLGFGCNIPGIMATRTLGSFKDRVLTILVLPLMSCSARLPVYTLFAAALFPRHQQWVVFSLYVLGIILAIIMARIFRKVFFKGEGTPLIMELPPYRWPGFKCVLLHMWFQSWLFVKKAGTVIFLFVVLTWALASLPAGVAYASKESLIGRFGIFIAPVFSPAGFGFWQAAVALLFGILAKEVVIGTLGTLYGVESTGLAPVLQQHFTPLSGYAFLVMTALYIPCIPTIAVIRKETSWKWAGIAVAYTFILGWTLSVVIYQIGNLLFHLQ